jgi:hypothetical protein
MSDIKTLEREAEVKTLEHDYPEAMRKVTRHYSERRAHMIDASQLVLESTVRAQAIGAEFARMASNAPALEEYYNVPGCNSHNEFDGDDSDHYGMSAPNFARELRGEASKLQANLEDARKELEKTGLKEALQENMVGMKKKRRRILSEHDGDWDLDRKWDAAPFMTTLMSRVEFPYIEIIFPINMNSGAGGKTIAKFNCRCLALAEVFESAGYRVAITGEGWQQGILRAESDNNALYANLGGNGRGAGDGREVMLTRFVLREANEYGDIQSFAAYSSVEFFRRTIFSCTYNAFHYIHGLKRALTHHVSSSFGSALSERPIPAANGQLVLTHDLIGKLFGTDTEVAARLFKERVAHVVSRSA